VSRWMTWLPISLKNAAKCDKWYQLQNLSITESLNANGARKKAPLVFNSGHAMFSVSNKNQSKKADSVLGAPILFRQRESGKVCRCGGSLVFVPAFVGAITSESKFCFPLFFFCQRKKRAGRLSFSSGIPVLPHKFFFVRGDRGTRTKTIETTVVFANFSL